MNVKKMIAFCGLDCAQCEAYKATQAKDEAAKLEILARWQADFGGPDMTLDKVTCDGCSSERVGGYCAECPVRVCAMAKGFKNCAYCDEIETCAILDGLIAVDASAKQSLLALRKSLGK
jgi:hypothetical protein